MRSTTHDLAQLRGLQILRCTAQLTSVRQTGLARQPRRLRNLRRGCLRQPRQTAHTRHPPAARPDRSSSRNAGASAGRQEEQGETSPRVRRAGRAHVAPPTGALMGWDGSPHTSNAVSRRRWRAGVMVAPAAMRQRARRPRRPQRGVLAAATHRPCAAPPSRRRQTRAQHLEQPPAARPRSVTRSSRPDESSAARNAEPYLLG